MNGAAAHLMVDANQVFSVAEALRRGKVYEQLGCYWFEEPLRADDLEGLARLARSPTIPIASGENNQGKRQFRRLFERRAVDIVQLDIRRAGGVTECLEIGLLADSSVKYRIMPHETRVEETGEDYQRRRLPGRLTRS